MSRECGCPGSHDGDCECHLDGIVLDDFTRESAEKRTAQDKPTMNIRPLQDQLLVRRDPEEDVSPGGIIITASHNPQLPKGRGVVIAVGPGLKRQRTVDTEARAVLARLIDTFVDPEIKALADSLFCEEDLYEPMDVKVGDRVVFSKLSGDKVRDDLAVSNVDDDLLLIRESEVAAILEDDQ